MPVLCSQYNDGVLAGTYNIPLLPGENNRGAITRKFQAALQQGWTVISHTNLFLEIQKVGYPPGTGYSTKRRTFEIV